jgi:hypothetical protein
MGLAFRIMVVAVLAGPAGLVVVAADPKPSNSPHADALALVLRTQADAIRKVEASEPGDGKGDETWWLDTKERTWVVKRPFGPGVVDTTHEFQVTYRIDGKDVAWWSVDTRKGTVTAAPKAKAK